MGSGPTRSSAAIGGWFAAVVPPMVQTMNERKNQKAGTDGGEPERLDKAGKPKKIEQAPGEVGGPEGPEPTRYGDWERNGRVSDF